MFFSHSYLGFVFPFFFFFFPLSLFGRGGKVGGEWALDICVCGNTKNVLMFCITFSCCCCCYCCPLLILLMMMTMTTMILLIFVAFTTADEKKREISCVSCVYFFLYFSCFIRINHNAERGREIFFVKRPPINGKLSLFL